MKIDLVGPARRGLATGLNEAAGYASLGATALLTGYLATTHGLRPLLFTEHGLGLAARLIKGLYPLRGFGQIPTGHLADRIGRKPLIVTGMFVQSAGFVLALVLLYRPLPAGTASAVLLGLGTAMVYPALIASVSDNAHPAWRANALGTYRFWRDLGYAGALVAGVLADALGLNATVVAAAALTAASGLLAARLIRGGTAH
ncbi:MFS transporter [Streptomyces kaniharaensis]|uniref:MFS transporter n=1 Tax=Streptomyces kaniharaensis TaxID=212423 RepID=UPI001E564FC4|nr:MFS transporter [Streptomyces kaniharaensis]